MSPHVGGIRKGMLGHLRAALTARGRAVVAVMALAAAASAGCAARQQVALRDDGAITKDVEQRLAADPIARGSTISVETKAGVVSLQGAVATDTVRSSAERIARNTPGVREVDNNVRFGGTQPHTN